MRVNSESALEMPSNEATASVGLASLFLSFFRIGLTAFGGPAMIPFLRKMAIKEKGWIEDGNFRVGLAVCQAIPGATVMQLAAYIGLRVRGISGAIAAFCGFGFPAFALITILSAVYFRYHDLPMILSVFSGLKIVVVAILISATLDFVNKYIRALPDKLLSVGAGVAFVGNLHPALVIAIAATIGVLCFRKDETQVPQPGCLRQGNGHVWGAVGLTVALALALGCLWLFQRELYQLAVLLMGVDILAFGGGFAALPVMLHEVVVRMGWLTEQVFLDGIALGQITPGPIVITAAFVGYALTGLAGAVVGAVAVFSPSFLLLLWSVPFCDRLLGSKYFRRGLRASLATLAGLMAAVTGTLVLSVHWSAASILLAGAAFVALRRHVDVLRVVIFGAGLSLFLF